MLTAISTDFGNQIYNKKVITEEQIMKSYVCTICGYVYDEEAGDPDNGFAPETKWTDVPNDWICPLCGASKEDFEER